MHQLDLLLVLKGRKPNIGSGYFYLDNLYDKNKGFFPLSKQVLEYMFDS